MQQKNYLVFFFLLAILFLAISETRPIIVVRGKLQQILIPASRSVYKASVASDKTTSALSEIKNLSRENAILKSENIELKSKLSELTESQFKLETLEKELSIEAGNRDKKFVAAAVVSRAPSLFQDVVLIDKGQKDGLETNQPVLSSGFLIGKITRVFPDSSQVELITSHRFIAPVVLQNSRLLGLLKGGVKGVQVEQLPIDGKIDLEETVVTSGLANQVPSGIPIGTISRVLSKPSDIFHTVSVNSPVNFNKLEYVVVMVK